METMERPLSQAASQKSASAAAAELARVHRSHLSLPPLAGFPGVKVDTTEVSAAVAKRIDELHFQVEAKALIGRSTGAPKWVREVASLDLPPWAFRKTKPKVKSTAAGAPAPAAAAASGDAPEVAMVVEDGDAQPPYG